MIATHRARPFEVAVRAYREGARMEDGWVAIERGPYVAGQAVIAVDPDGWELTTENFPYEKLREKATWLPGANLVPVKYVNGGRHVIWPGWYLVRFPGGVEMPMGPNEVTVLFEPLPLSPSEGDREDG